MDNSVTQLKSKKIIGKRLALVAVIGSLWTGGSQLSAETREIVANPELKAGAVYSFLFGKDYRDLWTSPVEMEVLDLSTEAGGLEAAFRVGGNQTFGLAFKGADGKSYTFRSLVKDLRQDLHPDLRNRKFGDFTQDQSAALHPAGAIMVPPLARAAGILHNEPRFVVLPDDPALGEFREVFAGRVGTLEEFPTKASDTYEGFFGATDIIKAHDFVTKWLATPNDRVDADALVRARLFDFFIGDWDRHANNFRWAKLPGNDKWQPLPEDRDQAFVSFEGAVISIVRPFEPRLLKFDEEYPVSFGLVSQGWPSLRWFLAELERDAWIATATDLQNRITDAVIEEAVNLMPKAYFDLSAEKLVRIMKVRRDRLPEIADRMYHFLNSEIDVQATEGDDRIALRGLGEGQIEVSLTSKTASLPYFRRVVNSSDTKSLRLFLRAGQDTVECSGPLNGKIKIDVVGSKGEDVLAGCERANLRFTDAEEIERRKQPARIAPIPFNKISGDEDNISAQADRPRDWQRAVVPIYQLSVDSRDGLVLGYGRDYTNFQFGKNPFGQNHKISGAVGVTEGTLGVNYDGTYQHWNPKVQSSLNVSVSSIERADFFGFGNETSDDGSDDFFENDQTRATITPSISYLATPKLNLFSGVGINYNSVDDDEDTLLNLLDPIGTGDFGYVSLFAGFDYDTRDRSTFNNPGVHLRVQANVSPEIWDADDTFGSVEGEAAGFVSLGSRSLLALRVGGERVAGDFPFQEAAYLGGDTTLRGFDDNRFAGDASVFANVELRFRLGRASAYVADAEYGLVVFGDVGRVFLDDIDDEDDVHSSGGAGISATALDRTFAVSAVLAVSDEETTGVFTAGFSF